MSSIANISELTAAHLPAVVAAAQNLGCEHLTVNDTDAQSAAYSLWTGLAETFGEEDSYGMLIDEINDWIGVETEAGYDKLASGWVG
jgi:hypothetical protein